MNRSVYQTFKKDVFSPFNPLPQQTQQATKDKSIQKQTQPTLRQKKINRSQQRDLQIPNRNTPRHQNQKSNTLSKSLPLSSSKNNYLFLFLQSLVIDRKITYFNKIRAYSGFQFKFKVTKLINIDKLIVKKQQNQLKVGWLKLISNQIISNKQLMKQQNKNSLAENYLKLTIATSVFVNHISYAFRKLKNLHNKQKILKPQIIGCIKALTTLFNRLLRATQRSVFAKLSVIKYAKYQSYKIKISYSILSRLLKQRMILGFNYSKHSTKIINQNQQQIVPKQGSFHSKSGSTKQSVKRSSSRTSSTLMQSKLSILNNKISQQLNTKQQQVIKNEKLDSSYFLLKQAKQSIESEQKKQIQLKSKLIKVKQTQKQVQQVKQQVQRQDDRLRVHRNDSLFYDKLKSMYLDLKQIKSQSINKTTFVQDYQVDFNTFLEHSQYLLTLNKQLKQQIKTIEQFISPSQPQKPNNYKIRKDIQDIKQDLSKQNDGLKQILSKHVLISFDDQWVQEQITKLKNTKIHIQQ